MKDELKNTQSQESKMGQLSKLKPYLKKHYGVKRVQVFGSWARGDNSANSDLDLLIEFVKPLGWRFGEMSLYLENSLGIKVDIITPQNNKSRPTKLLLEDIADSIFKIQKYVKDFDYLAFSENSLIIDASVRNLEIIGEAFKLLPQELKRQKSSNPMERYYCYSEIQD
jgi:uncharacterized protein